MPSLDRQPAFSDQTNLSGDMEMHVPWTHVPCIFLTSRDTVNKGLHIHEAYIINKNKNINNMILGFKG